MCRSVQAGALTIPLTTRCQTREGVRRRYRSCGGTPSFRRPAGLSGSRSSLVRGEALVRALCASVALMLADRVRPSHVAEQFGLSRNQVYLWTQRYLAAASSSNISITTIGRLVPSCGPSMPVSSWPKSTVRNLVLTCHTHETRPARCRASQESRSKQRRPAGTPRRSWRTRRRIRALPPATRR